MDIDDEDVDDDSVMINKSYDSSVAVDAMLSSFEPSITPLMQGEEGRGLSRLGDLSGIRHVVVVGLFCSGTNAMCEFLEKYSNVTVHPPRLPRTATGWIGDMSALNYVFTTGKPLAGWLETFASPQLGECDKGAPVQFTSHSDDQRIVVLGEVSCEVSLPVGP